MNHDPIRCTLRLAVGTAVALVAAVGCATATGPEPFAQITVDEVSSRLGQPGFHVLDANGPEKFAQARVPGARQVHFKNLTEEDLPADRAATLVFYCANER